MINEAPEIKSMCTNCCRGFPFTVGTLMCGMCFSRIKTLATPVPFDEFQALSKEQRQELKLAAAR